MSKARLGLLAKAATLWVATAGLAPALAQTTASTPDIVVHAQKPPPRDTVRRQIAAIASDSRGQLARFNDPVCPKVLGLNAAMGEAIESDFRATAASVGARVDSKTCEPNILIIVTDRAPEVFKGLRPQGQPEDSFRRANRELAATASVTAWNHTEIENEDGEGESPHTMVQGSGGVSYDLGPSLQVKTATMLGNSSQMAMKQAFVIISVKAALGKTPSQLADYAVMRTLADTHHTRSAQPGLDTILTLFDGDPSPPPRLSPFDRQYLTALYWIKPTQTSIQQAGDILSHMSTQDGERPVRGN